MLLFIWVPGMIYLSVSVNVLMNCGCSGCWGHHWYCRGSKAGKITTEVLEFRFILMFWEENNFCLNHKISCWILAPFLSDVVEASLCHFFKNWLMKHKFPNLLKHLGTIIHQNSQFYYPSEPFSFHHFNVRHPVHSLVSIYNFGLIQELLHCQNFPGRNGQTMLRVWYKNGRNFICISLIITSPNKFIC